LLDAFRDLDAVSHAVGHMAYGELGAAAIVSMVVNSGTIIDVKASLDPVSFP
jgi:hypothetical protein